MGVVGTVVDVHVLDEATADAVLGEHTFHHANEEGVHAGLEVLIERFLHQNLGGSLTLAAGISGVVEVYAIGHFLAGKNNFVGIDNDYVVAALHVGGVAGFVFTAQQFCHFCAKTTEYLIGGVDNDPLVLYFVGVGEYGAVANGIHS